jgi:hypothetical protein
MTTNVENLEIARENHLTTANINARINITKNWLGFNRGITHLHLRDGNRGIDNIDLNNENVVSVDPGLANMVTCEGPNGKIQISSKSMRQINGSKYMEHRDANIIINNPELKALFDWLSANSPRGLQNAGINNYNSRYSTLDDLLYRYIPF